MSWAFTYSCRWERKHHGQETSPVRLPARHRGRANAAHRRARTSCQRRSKTPRPAALRLRPRGERAARRGDHPLVDAAHRHPPRLHRRSRRLAAPRHRRRPHVQAVATVPLPGTRLRHAHGHSHRPHARRCYRLARPVIPDLPPVEPRADPSGRREPAARPPYLRRHGRQPLGTPFAHPGMAEP